MEQDQFWVTEYLLVRRDRGTAISNPLKYYKCFAKLCDFFKVFYLKV